MMDTGSSAAKRKRDESSMPGVPATSAQAKWITPSFGSPSPEKKKPKSMMKISATSAPAFRIKDVPTTPKPKVQAPTSPTATGTKFPAFKVPTTTISTTATPKINTPNGAGSALSSLQHRFGPPKQPLATPVKKEVKPLLPPAFPFTASSSSSSNASSSSKPLNQTPLTTRLAAIAVPLASSSSSSDGHPSSDDPHAQTRTSIAIKARELMVKSEEHDSAFGIKDEMDELLVGLNVSPEKPDRKGKGKRFVRNGLAERASHLLTRAQNDFSLWSHDLASSLSVAQDIRTYTTGAPRQRKPVKPVSPDLRLLVTETLTTFHTKEFKPSSRMIVPPAYCLARCKIKDTDVGDLLVLFSFAGSGGHGFAVPSIASPRGLEAGTEVLIWKPWIDIDLDHRISSALANEEDVKPIQSHPNPQTHNEGDDAPMEDIDTVPSTPTNEEDRKMIKAKMISILEEKGETSARRRAMLCSRFMVKR